MFRPQSGYDADIMPEPCALLKSLLIIHPLVDGNKGVAFASCDVFLRINGSHLRAMSQELYVLMMLDCLGTWAVFSGHGKCATTLHYEEG